MKTENKTELFETMPVPKAILTLAVPTIISQLISVIYNIADTFYVGRTGNPYMIAGVSLSLPLFLMTISFANLFGIGGGSQISRMMGAGKADRAKAVSAFAFYGALGLSLLYALLVFFFMEPVLKALGASDNTMEFCRQYTMYVVVLGTVPIVLSAVESHLLRNVGYSSQASMGLSGGGVLNIILDPLFMFVIFPKGQEVLAAAVATLISNVAAFLFLTATMLSVTKKAPLSISLRDLKELKKSDVQETMTVGIPSALLPGLFDVANFALNSLMAAHGDLQLAAMGITAKVERIPNAINIGISQGMLPLVAYSFTNGNHERMQNVIRTARKMGLIVSVCSIAFLEIFAPFLVGFFLDSSDASGTAAATLVFAATFLRLRATASPFQFLNYHTSYCMQAMGDGRDTMIHAIVRILILYIPAMYLLDMLFGENGLALALTISEALAACVALALLKRWIRKL